MEGVFEVVVSGRRLRREGDLWAEGTDLDLAGAVDRWPAAPHPVVRPGPIVEPDWSDEVWVYLHTLEVLDVLMIDRDHLEVVATPDFGDLGGDLPTDTVF